MEDDRWEHRAWFDEPAAPLDRLAADGTFVGSVYRTDTYLLDADTDSRVKLRGGDSFEVKTRKDSRDGMERWVKTAGLPFPLDPDACARLLPDAPAHALADAGALVRYAETLTSIRVARVRKHRRRYSLGGAEAEITAVQLGERVTQTLGIEAPRLEDAAAAARRLGTDAYPNRDYGAWIRTG